MGTMAESMGQRGSRYLRGAVADYGFRDYSLNPARSRMVCLGHRKGLPLQNQRNLTAPGAGAVAARTGTEDARFESLRAAVRAVLP